MYIRYRSIQVIALLSSMLLQGCGGLGLKMTNEEVLRDTTASPHSRSGTETQAHRAFPKQRTDQCVTEVSGELYVAPLPACPEAPTEVLVPFFHTLSSARSCQVARPTVSQSGQAIVAQHITDTSGAHVPSVCDAKMFNRSRDTPFSTLAAAQEAVATYLAQWRLETPSGRVAIREQGYALLRNVEGLKKATKRSYRKQVLGFTTQDIDPLVWSRVLQQQQTTQSQLNALRSLRTQLLDTCQMDGHRLPLVGIQTTTHDVTGEVELYSSDEDMQQLSDQKRKNHAAFVAGVGKVLKKHLEKELLALLDTIMKTKTAPYITLFSTPELPELLKAYIDSLKQAEDAEHSAALLGSLLTEAIIQCFVLPKAKKAQLHKLKHALGQAAYEVVLHNGSSKDTGKVKSVPKRERKS